MDQGGPPAEECTDVDGYLCPTFCERPLEGLVPTSQKLNEQIFGGNGFDMSFLFGMTFNERLSV